MKIGNLIWVIVALAIVPSAWLVSQGFKRTPTGEYIAVTGMAEVDFNSDLIVWSANFTRQSMDQKDAFQQIKSDQKKVESFLKTQGVKASEIIFGTVSIEKQFDYHYENGASNRVFEGYLVSQSVTVKSSRVEEVEEISRESMSLVEAGVEFNSQSPYFYYTKLADLKIDLIEKATKDARLRAEKIAKAAGSALGALKSSDLGVFQITGQYENEEYSWGGVFNTRSKLKTARVTVTCRYKPE